MARDEHGENDEGDAEQDTDTEEQVPPRIVSDHTHDAPDGTRLSIRIFRPAGSGADSPVPVLLQRTPYGKPEDVTERALAPKAIERGYAVAYEDTRGRGESAGEFLPWIHEATDGAATVEWLAQQAWSTGQVGMFGGSSPGHVQLFAAAEHPDSLAAIAPMFAPSDLHRSDFFQDGAMSAMTHITWALGESIAGHTVDRLERAGKLSNRTGASIRRALDAALDRLPSLVSHRPLVDLPDHVLANIDLPPGITPDDIVPHWREWVRRPTYDDFWRSFDAEVMYDEIDVPGLHLTGWYELCQNGTITNFEGLQDSASAPQHLVVGPWTHQDTSAECGDLAFPGGSADSYGIWERHLEFFDTYLKGEPGGGFVIGDTIVDTYRTTIDAGTGDGTWHRHLDWPPASARSEPWYLHSTGDAATNIEDGELARREPEKFEPPDTWTHDPDDPVPTRGGPLCCGERIPAPGPVDQREIEERDDVCTYTTAPLEAPIELAGPVSLSVALETTASDTDVTSTLVHVTDDGAYNLCDGIRRARYRHGRDRVSTVPQGEPLRLTVDMWDVHHVVPEGDRLRVDIASSNHPRFDPHPGTSDPWQSTEDDVCTADQTLYHERDRASVLSITRR